MSTIVGVEADGAVALAADRSSVTEGTVGGDVDRVFAYVDAGAAAMGDSGDVADFGRRLEAELDRDRLEAGRAPGVDRVARMAAEVAATAGVEALVAARDEDDTPRLRWIDAAGGVLSETVAAAGTGAEIALGVLGEFDVDAASGDLEERVREVLATVAERDAETGDGIDTWSLAAED